MFDQLFVRSDALTRYLSAPLVDERRQYLTHCAVQGMTKSTLEAKARLLLSIAEYLRLADRPTDTISLSEIKKAATRWSNHNWPSPQSSHAKRSQEYFMATAAEWLTFLNRLQIAPKPVTICDQMLAEFRRFMEEDRNLSPATVQSRCSSVRPFLVQLLDGRRSLETITVSRVDSLLAQKVNKEHYARVSVRDYASSLRAFFRYAEMRSWCPAGIYAAIIRYLKEVRPKSPHRQVFLTLRAPVGPISNGAMWAVVSRQLRQRAPSLKHHGPHSLRHACATRLINQGLSLKEIGDYLGHRDVEATRIYAKVDLAHLREVAEFDLGGLL